MEGYARENLVPDDPAAGAARSLGAGRGGVRNCHAAD